VCVCVVTQAEDCNMLVGNAVQSSIALKTCFAHNAALPAGLITALGGVLAYAFDRSTLPANRKPFVLIGIIFHSEQGLTHALQTMR
jgi:hypothetical protein